MTVVPILSPEPINTIHITKSTKETPNNSNNNNNTATMGSVVSRIIAKTSSSHKANGKLDRKDVQINNEAQSKSSPSPAPLKPNLAATNGIMSDSTTNEIKTAPPTTAVDLAAVPDFPANLTLTYLAEGAANVIYRISAPSGSPYENKLLRLRKALPSSFPNLPAFQSLLTRFHPLLPANSTVSTQLVRLPAGLIARENEAIKKLEEEGKRKESRRGLYLEEKEMYGFVLEDMTPHAHTGAEKGGAGPEVLVEFKPKWLVQSPNAPKNAKRCRTCALRFRKLAQAKKKGKPITCDILKSAYCPFDLESGDETRVRDAVTKMLAGKGAVKLPVGLKELNEEQKGLLVERTVKCLRENTLLKDLARIQTELDKDGMLKTLEGYKDGSGVEDNLDGHVGRLATAMTLRDLTLFLRVDLNPSPQPGKSPVLLRIGDLDLKSPANGKADYWVKTEKILIDEGWYTGTENRESLPEGIPREHIEHWCTLDNDERR